MAVTPRRKSKIALYLDEDAVPPDHSPEHGGKWLTKMLDEARTRGQELWEAPASWVRVSSAGDPCERSLSLTLLGWRDPFTARQLRIFATGRAIEEKILEEMRGAGILIDENATVHSEVDGVPINGHYDVLVLRPGTRGTTKELGELKSIKEEYWEKLPEPVDDPDVNFRNLLTAGYLGYLTQWSLYSHLMGEMPGFILFEAKNTQRRKIYALAYDYNFVRETLDRLAVTWSYASRGDVAPRNRDTMKDPVCQRCSKRTLCQALPQAPVKRAEAMRVDLMLRR